VRSIFDQRVDVRGVQQCAYVEEPCKRPSQGAEQKTVLSIGQIARRLKQKAHDGVLKALLILLCSPRIQVQGQGGSRRAQSDEGRGRRRKGMDRCVGIEGLWLFGSLPFDDQPALMFGAQCTCRLMHNVRANHPHMAGTAAVSDQTFTLPLDQSLLTYTMDMSRLSTQEEPHRFRSHDFLSTTVPVSSTAMTAKKVVDIHGTSTE